MDQPSVRVRSFLPNWSFHSGIGYDRRIAAVSLLVFVSEETRARNTGGTGTARPSTSGRSEP